MQHLRLMLYVIAVGLFLYEEPLWVHVCWYCLGAVVAIGSHRVRPGGLAPGPFLAVALLWPWLLLEWVIESMVKRKQP